MTTRLCWYAWAAPASVLGLALALPLILSGGRVERVAGVWEITGGRLVAAWFRSRWCPPFVAITFGHVILAVDRATLMPLRGHERVHVRQYERWGPLFLLLYPLASLFAMARGRDPYRDNCYEREAFAAADFGYDQSHPL